MINADWKSILFMLRIIIQLGLCERWQKFYTYTHSPATCLPFVGIILDTDHIELHLPDEKLTTIQRLLSTWLDKKKATK